MMISKDNPAYELAAKRNEDYEKYLIRAIDGSRAFFDRVKDTLCVSETGKDTDDFAKPYHNEIYRAIKRYYEVRSDIDAANISPSACRAFLQTSAEGGSGNIGIDEVETLTTYVTSTLQQVDVREAVSMVSEAYDFWLKRRRMRKMFQSVVSRENWDPDELMDQVKQTVSHIDHNQKKNQTSFTFGDGLDSEELDLIRYSSGLPALDAALGGGWAKTEYTLWIAPTSAGKTVMALQQGVTLVRQGLVGVIITTEQRNIELEPRVISAWANVPFDRIKDGVKMNKLTHTEAIALQKLRAELQGKLFFENWMFDRSKSVVNDLSTLVDEYKKKYGRCDFVILDWIGGALGEGLTPEGIRLTYQKTSDKMADMARDHDIITMAFIQANVTQSRNRKDIDASMISECKMAGANATNIIGISALIDRADNAATVYSQEQWLHCSKTRKGPTAPVRVRREFEYQRFKAWWQN